MPPLHPRPPLQPTRYLPPARVLPRNHTSRLPRMRRPAGPRVRLRELPALRLGALRVTSRQLDLLPSAESPEPTWEVLDERARGTQFIALSVRSVLNTSAATEMGFWSINPYVGCEFGCTYCYARDTHRYAMERSGVAGRAAAPRGRPSSSASWSRPASPRCWRERSIPPGSASIRWSSAPPPIPTSRLSGGSGSRAGSWRCCCGYRGLALGDHHQVAARHARHRPARPARRAARGDGQHLARHAGPAARPPARAALAGAGGADPGTRPAHRRGRPRGATSAPPSRTTAGGRAAGPSPAAGPAAVAAAHAAGRADERVGAFGADAERGFGSGAALGREVPCRRQRGAAGVRGRHGGFAVRFHSARRTRI